MTISLSFDFREKRNREPRAAAVFRHIAPPGPFGWLARMTARSAFPLMQGRLSRVTRQ
jgi:hypothetical protein